MMQTGLKRIDRVEGFFGFLKLFLCMKRTLKDPPFVRFVSRALII